jgi:hypothetical protein
MKLFSGIAKTQPKNVIPAPAIAPALLYYITFM